MMIRIKKKNSIFGKYPSNDMLNNALRFLLRDEPNVNHAIEEIVYAIGKADGYIFDDIKEQLKKKGFLKGFEGVNDDN